jgi:hypothetical protein
MLMTMEELTELGVNRLGDRLALRSFCKSNVDTSHDDGTAEVPGCSRQELVDKIKVKMDDLKKGKCVGKRLGKHLAFNQHAKKMTRRVEIGWMKFDVVEKRYKQVKERNGGGIRKLTVSDSTSMKDILCEAIDLFVKCKDAYVDHSIGLFDGSTIDSEASVNDVYHSTKVKMLRLYLHSSPANSEDALKMKGKPVSCIAYSNYSLKAQIS